jgi:hypothetical protein
MVNDKEECYPYTDLQIEKWNLKKDQKSLLRSLILCHSLFLELALEWEWCECKP